MKIILTTIPEDISPEQAEKLHGYAEGFAESVKQVQDSIESSSDLQWGWCTVKVSVEIEDKYNGIKRVGDAYLGECSYKSAADFIANSCYFQDLVNEALNNARPVKLRSRATVAPESDDSSPVEHKDSLSIQHDHLVNTRVANERVDPSSRFVTLNDTAPITKNHLLRRDHRCRAGKLHVPIEHGHIYEALSRSFDKKGLELISLKVASVDNGVLNHVIVTLPFSWFRPITNDEWANSVALFPIESSNWRDTKSLDDACYYRKLLNS